MFFYMCLWDRWSAGTEWKSEKCQKLFSVILYLSPWSSLRNQCWGLGCSFGCYLKQKKKKKKGEKVKWAVWLEGKGFPWQVEVDRHSRACEGCQVNRFGKSYLPWFSEWQPVLNRERRAKSQSKELFLGNFWSSVSRRKCGVGLCCRICPSDGNLAWSELSNSYSFPLFPKQFLFWVQIHVPLCEI